MANLAQIIDRQITNAFDKLLAPGGLTEQVTFKFFVSDGAYDIETDTIATAWNDVPGVSVVAAKPTYDDMKQHGAIAADMKLILPASKLPSKPEADTDKVVRANGEEWDVRKTIEVPGGAIYIVYIFMT